jgi:hypothetical protein
VVKYIRVNAVCKMEQARRDRRVIWTRRLSTQILGMCTEGAAHIAHTHVNVTMACQYRLERPGLPGADMELGFGWTIPEDFSDLVDMLFPIIAV